jgi:hypothetical protein
MPDSRISDPGLSKLPNSGVMPLERNSAARPEFEVSANKRTRLRNCPATRKPTSPQPTIKTRSRRKREGKEPRGVWFEGKIVG